MILGTPRSKGLLVPALATFMKMRYRVRAAIGGGGRYE